MSVVQYRESHIAWLGEIPQHWEAVPLRACFYEFDERCGDVNYELLSVTQERGIVSQSDIIVRKDVSNEDKAKYKIVPHYAIAYNKMRMWQGAVGINSVGIGIVSPAYIVVNPAACAFPQFFAYLFKTPYMLSEFGRYSYGLCDDMNTLRYVDFQKIRIFLPPLQEQKAIAEFLDRKCGQIQRFITQKENLIKLLEELRESTINEAITQGLDKSVERKPSGVEWLGEIPQHWEIRRFAMLGNFSKGSGLSRKDIRQDGVPCVLYGDIYTKYDFRILHAISKTTKEVGENCPMAINGDILIAGSGETKEDIGKAVVYGGNESLCIGGDIILFRPRGINSMFLSYVLNSSYAKSKKFLMAKGEIIVHIYASSLRDLQIPLPPLQEQEAIAEYLEGRLAKIDTAIEKTKNQVELMREYKTSLISQAVSGKINIKE